jgi:WD40 repeat protein
MSYKAFISYSHAADGKLAPALQSGLQRIAKPFYRLRAMRVFRDETSLRLTPKLWTTIQQSIHESENFILMASPEAAKSKWVQSEIEEWLKLKNSSLDNFSIVLTEGEIVWDNETNDFDWEKTTALPKHLQSKFESEPLYLDFRWAKESEHLSLRNPRFLNSVGKLAAAIRNETLDALVGEDVRQHRVFKFITGAVIVALLFLIIAIGYAAFYANQQTKKANASLKTILVESGRQALNNNNPFQAAVYLIEAYKMPIQDEEQGETSSLRFLLGLSMRSVDSLRFSLEHQDFVSSAEFSPDGKQIATSSEDKTAKIWDVATGKLLTSVEHQGGVNSARFSPDGKQIVTAGSVNTAKVWDAATGKLLASVEHRDTVLSARFSPDGKQIVTASTDRTAKVWDVATGKLLASMEHQFIVNSARFSPDGKQVVTASDDDTAKVWDGATGKLLASMGHQGGVNSAEYSPDGKQIVTASEDKNTKVWNFPPETRSVNEIEEIVGAKVPYRWVNGS